MYLISTTPYMDNKYQNDNYKDIIVINTMPQGPLSSIVKPVKPPKLSPFKGNNDCNCKCLYAILSLENHSKFMCIDEIPELTTFLSKNSYTFEYDMTKIMLKNHILKNVIYFISYPT